MLDEGFGLQRIGCSTLPRRGAGEGEGEAGRRYFTTLPHKFKRQM